eukprot:1782137-Prymnesium_polylepis.1
MAVRARGVSADPPTCVGEECPVVTLRACMWPTRKITSSSIAKQPTTGKLASALRGRGHGPEHPFHRAAARPLAVARVDEGVRVRRDRALHAVDALVGDLLERLQHVELRVGLQPVRAEVERCVAPPRRNVEGQQLREHRRRVEEYRDAAEQQRVDRRLARRREARRLEAEGATRLRPAASRVSGRDSFVCARVCRHRCARLTLI